MTPKDYLDEFRTKYGYETQINISEDIRPDEYQRIIGPDVQFARVPFFGKGYSVWLFKTFNDLVNFLKYKNGSTNA